jgi:hypothetical protein
MTLLTPSECFDEDTFPWLMAFRALPERAVELAGIVRKLGVGCFIVRCHLNILPGNGGEPIEGQLTSCNVTRE